MSVQITESQNSSGRKGSLKTIRSNFPGKSEPRWGYLAPCPDHVRHVYSCLIVSLDIEVKNTAEKTMEHLQVSIVLGMNRNSHHCLCCPFISTIPALTFSRGRSTVHVRVMKASSVYHFLHAMSEELKHLEGLKGMLKKIELEDLLCIHE